MKYKITILLLASFSFAGCTGDFEEMNTSPSHAVNTSPAYVLPYIQERTMHISATEGYQTTEELYTQQYCQYFTNTNSNFLTDRYAYNDDWAMDFWDPYFKALKHVKALKGELDEHPEYTNIVQMLRIVTANATIAMTDIFGDLPYSEAGLGVDGPAYDSQKDIYYDIFKELTEASSILAQNLSGQDVCDEDTDLFFAGDIDKWRKFANSLRLRCALRIVYVDPDKAKAEGEAAIADGLMESNADNVSLRLIGQKWGHPLAQTASFNDFRMSRTMENILKNTSSVADPRRELWFGVTANYMKKYVLGTEPDLMYKGEAFSGVPNGVPVTEFSAADEDGWIEYHVDNNSRPYGLQFFPDWNSGNVTNADATLPLPCTRRFKVMGYPEVCLLKSEAALREWAGAGDAKANYIEGIRASFETERDGVDASLYSTENDETYINTGDVAWVDGGGLDVNLEKIAVQKWLAVYPYSMEAWAECRRTGFPELTPVLQSDDPDIDPSKNEFVRKSATAMPNAGTMHSMLPTLPLTKARETVWRYVYGGIPMKDIQYRIKCVSGHPGHQDAICFSIYKINYHD